MNTYIYLLELIKRSQFGTTEPFELVDADFDHLYSEASIQAVTGLVSQEIIPYNNDKKWSDVLNRQRAFYIRYCYAEGEIKRLLDKDNIPFVILKGNASAIYYKSPYLRSMGDIDFFVTLDNLQKAKEILIQNGYTIYKDSENDPRHIEFVKDGIHFELHHHFSHEDLNVDDYIVNALDKRIISTIESHEFPMLPKLENGIVILVHMRNHIKHALGLRHIVDWMMYVYHNLDDDFWNNTFKSIAESKGIDTLAITVTRMCQLYLGLPDSFNWCKSADSKTCELLLNSLFVSGNFGRKNNAGDNIEYASTNMKRHGFIKWLQHAGEFNWKAYHKHHWLKPFCCFYQIFRYAKQGFKTGRNKKQIKQDLDRSKERFELLKKLGID